EFKKWYEDDDIDKKIYESNTNNSNINSKLGTIILAMGLGKTFTAVACVKTQYSKKNKIKVLWAAHREELIDQAYNEFVENIDANIQIEMSSRSANPDADIVIGSVQTLVRSRKNMAEFKPDLIVIDEFHHYHEENIQYHGLLNKYPKAKILGLTATPYRFAG